MRKIKVEKGQDSKRKDWKPKVIWNQLSMSINQLNKECRHVVLTFENGKRATTIATATNRAVTTTRKGHGMSAWQATDGVMSAGFLLNRWLDNSEVRKQYNAAQLYRLLNWERDVVICRSTSGGISVNVIKHLKM